MRHIALALLLLSACAADDAAIAPVENAILQSTEPKDSAWILNPAVLDESHWGTTNCSPHVADDPRTFSFGSNRGCTFEVVHEESACFERAVGHGGWIRQHTQSMHCEFVALCGGPGDLNNVRLCRDPGDGTEPGSWTTQLSACGLTGPFGCAPCLPPGGVCH